MIMTTNSFSDLLSSTTDQNLGGSERPHMLSDGAGSGVPKFKSTAPPLLPPISPSSYFANIPHGLSLSELLDSPVLLNSSHVSPLILFLSFLFLWNGILKLFFKD